MYNIHTYFSVRIHYVLIFRRINRWMKKETINEYIKERKPEVKIDGMEGNEKARELTSFLMDFALLLNTIIFFFASKIYRSILNDLDLVKKELLKSFFFVEKKK